MKIISRYVLRFYFSVLGVALFASTGIYLIVDCFEKIDNLLGQHVNPADAICYFLYKIPFILTQGIPMASLLATLICLGVLNRNREIIALKAAGVSIQTYAIPILFTSLITALVHFGIAEWLVHDLNHKAEEIWQQRVEQRYNPMGWSQENIWFRGKDQIYQVRLYDQRSLTLEKVSIFYVDSDFRLVKRLDANRISWQGNHWFAENGVVLSFAGPESEIVKFKEQELDLPETPRDFSALETVPGELGWFELHRYAEKLRQEGLNATPYEVQLQLRIAFPLTAVIIVLLGIPIALRQGPRGSMALSVGIGLVVACLYFAVFQIGTGLATAGILSPLLGVWSGNLLSALAGAYFLYTAPQ
jgi:lipopolysaccharide export system permease protein